MELLRWLLAHPGVEVGAGLRRLQSSQDTALVFSASIPLPYFNKNQGLVAEAEARKLGAAADQNAALVKARVQLFRNYRELLDRERELTALRARALPRMESALKNTEYAYARGRYSYLELVDAQRELIAVRSSIIESARNGFASSARSASHITSSHFMQPWPGSGPRPGGSRGRRRARSPDRPRRPDR